MLPSDNAMRAPMMNAYGERFIKLIQEECLDKFVLFGTRHLNYLCGEYLAHYLEERPYQGLGNATIRRGPPVPEADVVSLREVRCRQRLSGLLKSYHRQAA
jgi:putative transposase